MGLRFYHRHLFLKRGLLIDRLRLTYWHPIRKEFNKLTGANLFGDMRRWLVLNITYVYIIFDNFIAEVFMLIFDPGYNGLFYFIYPNVGCIFMVTSKHYFVIPLLLYWEAVPFLLQKPRFIFFIYKLYALNFLKTEMMLLFIPLELISVITHL